MTIYTFFVPGNPQGKLRARTRSGFGFYTPKKTTLYEAHIRTCFLLKYKFWPKLPPCVPVSVNIDAVFSSPKKKSKAGPVLKKPDVDNIAKVVLDAMNKCVWSDDSQVHGLAVSKVYDGQALSVPIGRNGAVVNPQPGLVIRIYCNMEEKDG